MPPLTATAFSWEWILKLNGADIDVPFGNMRFTANVDGYGTGVAIGQFDFELYDESNFWGEALLENATVELVEKNSRCFPSKMYYISKRSVSKNVCHFTAYDAMSRVEQVFDSTQLTVTDCGNVLNAICYQCGFAGSYATGEGIDYIVFTKSQLENRTCRALLEMIAEAMQGVWVADTDGSIVLSCIGAEYDTSRHIIDAIYYSEIDYQGRQKITGIVFTNTDTGAVNVLKTDDYGVILNISSPFVAAGTGLDSAVWERLQDHIYQAWHCDKAVIDGLAVASSYIGFGDTEMLTNTVSLDEDSTGIYFSGGCEPQDEEQWKYEEYLERAKIGIGKAVGNAVIDNRGRTIYRNLNETECNLDEHDNGICYYRSNN